MLIQWWLQHNGKESVLDYGPRFTLAEPDGRTVWSLDLPGDYSFPNDRGLELKWHALVENGGAILDARSPHAFDLYFVKAAKRVSFSVTCDADRKWRVTETARSDYSPTLTP